MKKILLLGGSSQQVTAIITAKRLGYYTVLCDFLPDNPGQFEADKFYLVSTTDKEAILKVAQEENVDGVLAYASDPAAPTAAYVAEKLELPGIHLNAVEKLCNKDSFREFLSKNGFNSPIARGYATEDDVIKEEDNFQYPIIIKPVDCSGSKGVTVLRDKTGLKEAVRFAFSFSRTHRVVVEKFLEKDHPYLIGGDIFVYDGKIVLWGLLNCHRDEQINALVPVGKSYPLVLSEEYLSNVKNTLIQLVAKLGIRNGAMNVELVVDNSGGVWLIDIGPRCGGNMIPNLLGDIFAVDVVEMSVQAAMGEKIVCEPKHPTACYATHNLHSGKKGTYRAIKFSNDIESYIYRKCIYSQPGDTVYPFDNAAKCLGIIFMRFENERMMEYALSNINRQIKIVLGEEKIGNNDV